MQMGRWGHREAGVLRCCRQGGHHGVPRDHAFPSDACAGRKLCEREGRSRADDQQTLFSSFRRQIWMGQRILRVRSRRCNVNRCRALYTTHAAVADQLLCRVNHSSNRFERQYEDIANHLDGTRRATHGSPVTWADRHGPYCFYLSTVGTGQASFPCYQQAAYAAYNYDLSQLGPNATSVMNQVRLERLALSARLCVDFAKGLSVTVWSWC